MSLHRHRADLPAPHLREDLDQPRQVEDVSQAFTVGFQDDRERTVAAGDGKQVRRTLPLKPQGSPRTGPAPRQEQRSGGILAEVRSEKGGVRKPLQDHLLHILGRGEEGFGGRRFVAASEPYGDTVVAPDRLHFEPAAVGEHRLNRLGPRRMHPPPEWGEDDDAPIAQFVAEPLHNYRPVGGQRARRLLLLRQVSQQIAGRPFVQVVRFL